MALRILVVEDNLIVLRMMRDLLEHFGHEVLLATDVAEALACFERLPQLALVDIEIPGGGGHALLRRVREDARFARVPLIAVTAHAAPEDHDRLLADGFDGFAGKPLDVRKLPQLVAEWSEARRATDEGT